MPDPAAWFRETKGDDPDYSRILDDLAGTPEERRAILHGFIAPTPEDVEAGIKVPTAAHRAIAALASRGYIRVIVTTNFDRLIETALRDAGVEPTVIASPDDAVGAIPLIHCACVVLKLHGDYLDTRIRNTPAELAAYDPRLDAYLDRVLDEFGLLIVGWSGEYDEALRAAIARCPTRRFTTWWAAMGGVLTDQASDLVAARRAEVISIENADRLFDQLEQKILSLEEVYRPHPLSAKLAVAEAKRYLLDPQQRIRLHDLILGEVQATIERGAIDVTSKAVWSEDEIRRRVSLYEGASEILRALVAVGYQWCREDDEYLWCEAIRQLCNVCRDSDGLVGWVELRNYLPMLVFFAAGLGATAAKRYRLLLRLFESSFRDKQGNTVAVLNRFLPDTAFSSLNDAALQLLHAAVPNHRTGAPVSEHLNAVMKKEKLTFGTNDDDEFDDLFDRFEVLAALSHLHRNAPEQIDARENRFVPRGRFMWRMRTSDALRDWLSQADRDEWPPIGAGMFDGSFERFSNLRTALYAWIK